MAASSPDEVNAHILNAIRLWVWSGFYTPEEVDQMIDDLLEEGADEDKLRAAVAPEFAKKAEAEKTWPVTTDCDRLDAAFKHLAARGILCLHNAGYTMSEGHQEAYEIRSLQTGHSYVGYCFYHGQDVERAVNGGGLMLAFNHVKGDVPDKALVGQTLKEELEAAGLSVDWNGTSDTRINIPQIDWKNRQHGGAKTTLPPPAAPVPPTPKPTSFWGRLYAKLTAYG